MTRGGFLKTVGSAAAYGNEEFKPELWDAVKVVNPFAFPLTIAPMEVVEEGRILGQNPCAWTNPGDEAIVKVTKALSVKGAYEERGDRIVHCPEAWRA